MPFGSGKKRGSAWKEVSKVDKNTVKCDHCELKISNKVEKCKTMKGNNYKPEYDVR